MWQCIIEYKHFIYDICKYDIWCKCTIYSTNQQPTSAHSPHNLFCENIEVFSVSLENIMSVSNRGHWIKLWVDCIVTPLTKTIGEYHRSISSYLQPHWLLNWHWSLRGNPHTAQALAFISNQHLVRGTYFASFCKCTKSVAKRVTSLGPW